ncbi:MAG: hypothetical protein KDK64_03295 [Chlamydiia bacterium]|nr:hypothetical protein [Chlamydiia bacterium]
MSIKQSISTNIEKAFLQLDRASDPALILSELDDSISLLRDIVISEKGKTQGTVVEVYERRLQQAQAKFAQKSVVHTPPSSPRAIQKASSSGGSSRSIKMIEGETNQYTNPYGYREICSGTALAFLDIALNHGQATIDRAGIGTALNLGAEMYHNALGRKQKQDAVLGVEVSDAQSQQLHPFNVVDQARYGMVQKRSPKSVSVKNPREFKASLADVIGSQLVPLAQAEGRSGMTLSFNGKTYGISVEMKRDTPVFMFFDSHGVRASHDNAFAFATSDLEELVDFIGDNASFMSRALDEALVKTLIADGMPRDQIALLGAPQDGDNEMGFFLVGPKPRKLELNVFHEHKEAKPVMTPESVVTPSTTRQSQESGWNCAIQ